MDIIVLPSTALVNYRGNWSWSFFFPKKKSFPLLLLTQFPLLLFFLPIFLISLVRVLVGLLFSFSLFFFSVFCKWSLLLLWEIHEWVMIDVLCNPGHDPEVCRVRMYLSLSGEPGSAVLWGPVGVYIWMGFNCGQVLAFNDWTKEITQQVGGIWKK